MGPGGMSSAFYCTVTDDFPKIRASSAKQQTQGQEETAGVSQILKQTTTKMKPFQKKFMKHIHENKYHTSKRLMGS